MKVEQKAKEYLKAQCQKRKEEFVIRMPEVYIVDVPQAFIDGYNEGFKDCTKAKELLKEAQGYIENEDDELYDKINEFIKEIEK